MNVDEEIFNFRHAARAQPPLQDASMNLETEAELPDGQVDDNEMAEASADPFHQMTPAADAETAMQPYNMATLPQAPQPGQATSSNIHLQQQQLNIHQKQQQQNMSQYNYDQRQITVNINSPTYKSYGPNPTFGRLPLTPRTLRATGPYGQPAPRGLVFFATVPQ